MMLLNVANLLPYKGQKDLIRAFEEVAREMIEPELHIAGENRGLGAELVDLAIELGVKNRVWFHGRVDDLESLYRQAWIYVHSSHEEGCSNAIIEAMWFGLPVVATAVGGVPEIVIHGATGLLVPAKDPTALANAVLCLYYMPGVKVRAMGEHGMKIARKKFTKKRMINEYRRLYACAK